MNAITDYLIDVKPVISNEWAFWDRADTIDGAKLKAIGLCNHDWSVRTLVRIRQEDMRVDDSGMTCGAVVKTVWRGTSK